MKEEQSKQDVRALFHFFSRNIREQLLALPLEADGMEEVRLRVSAPLYYIYKNKEYTAGSGFRVSLGDRVGSAVLSGGQLCRGRGGRPLGLGHVTICAGGRPCRCGGRGCLELYVRSPEVLKKLYHRTGLEASYADFCRITGSGDSSR